MKKFVLAGLCTVALVGFVMADEFGATCAFLCSVHAAYLTGQNILLDGGAYPAARARRRYRPLCRRDHTGGSFHPCAERPGGHARRG